MGNWYLYSALNVYFNQTWSCFQQVFTSAMGSMLLTSWRPAATGATLGSWTWFVATKLKPRNNWCVFALGGMPGESGRAETHRQKGGWAGGSLQRLSDKISRNQIILRSHCLCVCLGLPVGVLEVNSGSKWKVSSGRPTVGLNGGLISFLYSFYREQHSWTNHKITFDLSQTSNTISTVL